MIWLTSDNHFNHDNIRKYCNRPFADTATMDERLILNINNCVTPSDTLYFLGDWVFPRGKDFNTVARQYRDRVNCRNIVFIWGNHDNKGKAGNELPSIFNGCHDILEVEDEGQKIILCHYAIRAWDKQHHGSWHFYGHSHGGLLDDPKAMSMDVGVDAAAKYLDTELKPENYRPLCMGDIRDIFRKNKENYK